MKRTQFLDEDHLLIKVSAKSARLKFIECGPACISRGCTAKCCDAPTHPDGMRVYIDPTERKLVERAGGRVINNWLQPARGCRGCPFKRPDHLCGLHGTPAKPFGCIASPFMLNPNHTLVIRNRYKLLPCYDAQCGEPAYRVFRSSLVLILGEAKTDVLTKHLESGGGDRSFAVPYSVVDKLSHREESFQKAKQCDSPKLSGAKKSSIPRSIL